MTEMMPIRPPGHFAAALVFWLVLPTGLCQVFVLSGYEGLTEPGHAHLILTVSPEANLSDMSLRIQISGPMAGALLYPQIRSPLDLGYFHLESGNYTFDFYVLESMGASLADSSVRTSEQVQFTVPSAPAPPAPGRKLIDPVNLGFMVTALFVFGLVLIITRTTGAKNERKGGEEA